MSILLTVFPRTINAESHKHVLNHNYVTGQPSILMPYLNPWWEFCVSYIPHTVAPNVITLVGFFIYMTGISSLIYTDPYLSSTNPSSSACFFMAFSWFVYHTLDAIDGKHARNTKNTSPLGQ
eukprot:338089_1